MQFSRFLRDSQNGSKIPKGTPLGYGIPWNSMEFHDPQGGGAWGYVRAQATGGPRGGIHCLLGSLGIPPDPVGSHWPGSGGMEMFFRIFHLFISTCPLEPPVGVEGNQV